MATTFEKSENGIPEAVRALYEGNKKEVMLLCSMLLCDETAAGKAVTFAFQSAWDSLLACEFQNEEELRKFLRRKAVNYCRVHVTKQNSKAFRAPANKNFGNIEYLPEQMDTEGTTFEIVLHNLPVLHRFVYVLRTFGWYDESQIARLLNISEPLVKMAGEAESVNFDRILAAAGIEESYSDKAFKDDLLAQKEQTAVPPASEERIYADINEACRPFVEKKKKRTLRIAVIAAIVILAAAATGIGIRVGRSAKSSEDTETEETTTEDTTEDTTDSDASDTTDSDETDTGDTEADGVTIDVVASYYADIEIENYGTITVALDATAAPETVANFVSLANSGFYNGLTFHRIIEGFMMQGGDPNGDGTGGSDTTITGEFSDNGVTNNLSHIRGAISMARSSDYDSASSQFFIMQEDNTSLDGQYAVFGYVTSGLSVVDAVCDAAEPTDDNGTISADQQPVITSITIRDGETTE